MFWGEKNIIYNISNNNNIKGTSSSITVSLSRVLLWWFLPHGHSTHVLLLLVQASTADKVERSADGDEEANSNKMEEGCGELLQHDFQNGTWHFLCCSSWQKTLFISHIFNSESSLGSSEQLPDSDSELDEGGQRSRHSPSTAMLGSEASLDDDQVSNRDSLDLSSQDVSHTEPEQEAEQGPDNHESAEPPMLPDTEPPEEEPATEQDLSVSLAELNVNQSNNNLPCSPVVNMLGVPLAPLCGKKLVLTRNRSSMPEFVWRQSKSDLSKCQGSTFYVQDQQTM